MAQHFDPYFKWLGIPPDEQPPNYYRLLSIPLLVDDPDVIANAADRQMLMLRSLQAGERASLSQQLLNEISQAKACLLSPEKKAAYDASLAASSTSDDFQPPPSTVDADARLSSPLPARPAPRRAAALLATFHDADNDDAVQSIDFAPRPSTKPRATSVQTTRGRTPPARRGIHPVWYAIGAGLLIGIVALSFLLLQGGSAPKPMLTTATADITVVSSAEPSQKKATGGEVLDLHRHADPPDSNKPLSTSQAANPIGEVAPSPPAPKNAPPIPRPDPPADIVSPPQNPQPPTSVATPQPPEPVVAPTSPAGEPAPVERLTLPAAAAIASKTHELRELLKSEFKEAQSKPEGRGQFHEKLMNLARESLAKDSVTSYVCAVEAAALVADRDLKQAFATLDWLDKHFELPDAASRKGELIRRFKIELLSNDDLPAMVTTLEALMDAAEEKIEFGVIAELGKVAMRAARKTKDPALVSRLQARSKQLGSQRIYFEPAAQAMKALAKDPKDPQANLDLGRFLCFVRGNWDAGLPRLAAGSDAELAALARRDLARPSTPQEQLQMANAWWALSDMPNSGAPTEIRQRAAYYYSQAAPKLGGLEKVRAEQRAATLVAKEPANQQGAAKQPQPANSEPGETISISQLEMLGSERFQRRQVIVRSRQSTFETRTFKGTEFPNSMLHSLDVLSAHRDGFKVDKQFLTIQGEVLSDSASQSAVVIFYILADNRPIWRSQRLASEDGIFKFQVSIANAQVVQLICENVGKERVRSAWANVTATKKKSP